MSVSVPVALEDVREWSGGPPGCPGVFGRPSRMSGCGRETLGDVRESLSDAGSGRETPRMSRSSREAFPDVREWSGGPPKCPGLVGWPFRMSGSGREALPDVREWFEGPLECPEVVRSPSGMSGSGREALPHVQE